MHRPGALLDKEDVYHSHFGIYTPKYIATFYIHI